MTNFTHARFEASCFRPEQLITEEACIPEIAIAGRSNVGKSSLINVLLNAKLAKTGQTPGKTRSINFYRVDIPDSKTESFRLVDLPGYGYAARSRDERNEWRRLVSSYMKDRESLRLVLHLVDFRHGLLKNDRELQEYIRSTGKNLFVVFTKADKIAHAKWKKLREEYVMSGMYSFDMPIITSSEKKEGFDSLSEFIVRFLTDSKYSDQDLPA